MPVTDPNADALQSTSTGQQTPETQLPPPPPDSGLTPPAEPQAPETPATDPAPPVEASEEELAALAAAIDGEPEMVEFTSRMSELRVLFGLDDRDTYQFHGGKLRVSKADAERLKQHRFYHEEHFFLSTDVVVTNVGVDPVQRLPERVAKWKAEGATIYAMPGSGNHKLTLVTRDGAMRDVQFEDGYVAVRDAETCVAMSVHLFAVQGRMFRLHRAEFDPVEDDAVTTAQ